MAFNGENFGQFTANSQYLSLMVTIKILQLTLIITNITPKKKKKKKTEEGWDYCTVRFKLEKRIRSYPLQYSHHMPQGVDIKLKCSYVISSGHNHFWISVSSFVIGWDQNQNKANLAEKCWKQEEADFFFCGGHVVMR